MCQDSDHLAPYVQTLGTACQAQEINAKRNWATSIATTAPDLKIHVAQMS